MTNGNSLESEMGRRATLTVGEAWGDRRPVTQIVFIGTRGGVDGTWLRAQLTGEPARAAASLAT